MPFSTLLHSGLAKVRYASPGSQSVCRTTIKLVRLPELTLRVECGMDFDSAERIEIELDDGQFFAGPVVKTAVGFAVFENDPSAVPVIRLG